MMELHRQHFIEALIDERDYAVCARTTYRFDEERAYAEKIVLERDGQDGLDRFLRIALGERLKREARDRARTYQSENRWDIAWVKTQIAARNEKWARIRQILQKVASWLVRLVKGGE